MSAEKLLRKAVLERMSSPEQLDTLMRITSPVGWLALSAVGVVLLAVIVWSVVAELSVKVGGEGILVRGDHVKAIEVGANGTVASVEVKKEDVIVPGQIVARLSIPEIENRLSTERSKLVEVERERGSAQSGMEAIESGLRAQIGRLQADRQRKAALVQRGLLTREALSAIDRDIAQLQQSLIQSQIGRGERGIRVGDVRLTVKELEARLEVESKVRSPFGGRVVAILAGPGQQIRTGDRLMTLESDKEPVRFVGYVPLKEGKKVKQGLEARISPSNIKVEEFGFIVGKVTTVSEFPATREELRRTLNNDQLADRFAKMDPFQMMVDPVPAPANPSGMKWTSSGGPPIKIDTGTSCTVQVVVETRKPISLVIPTVKKTLGL